MTIALQYYYSSKNSSPLIHITTKTYISLSRLAWVDAHVHLEVASLRRPRDPEQQRPASRTRQTENSRTPPIQVQRLVLQLWDRGIPRHGRSSAHLDLGVFATTRVDDYLHVVNVHALQDEMNNAVSLLGPRAVAADERFVDSFETECIGQSAVVDLT
ncbi:hypothetical protein ON010_g14175 [Phytophthora cinnamomi]|nr:hypothetical protein ON010_g14175 [Phytophthora cinnamomi]